MDTGTARVIVSIDYILQAGDCPAAQLGPCHARGQGNAAIGARAMTQCEGDLIASEGWQVHHPPHGHPLHEGHQQLGVQGCRGTGPLIVLRDVCDGCGRVQLHTRQVASLPVSRSPIAVELHSSGQDKIQRKGHEKR